MSEMRCLSCGAETSNGLALCERCRIAASVILEFVPVYFANLTRWRPGRAGSRQVPGSREPSNDSHADRVSRILDEVGADITGWAECLIDDRPQLILPEADDEPAMMAALCRWFAAHMTTIATLGWAGEFLAVMGEHEQHLRRLTERVAPGWYAGACRRCGYATHVIPGLTWVTCGSCGATTYARDHLDIVLDEAREWVAPPVRLAEAIVALVDTEQSVYRLRKRIGKWGERGQLEVIRRDDYAPRRYRLGEVLDRLLAEGETRLDDDDLPISGAVG